jgi:LmbE family N-acetylglucosaminyl deacetylase
MKLSLETADLFVPDAAPMPAALARTTHLAIGAHQDDAEFFAYHGIAQCFQRADNWFTAVTCTNGGGSARTGPYAALTDEQMQAVRKEEQRKAAVIGEYACAIQLGFSSAEVKNAADSRCAEDLLKVLTTAQPTTVYIHNPADKHDTHVAVFWRSLQALRQLPPAQRPGKIYGCEVWRNLDWLLDVDKVALPTGARPNLQAALNGVFDSQITGGKRYDQAVMGRRLANATFFESHATDTETGLGFAMDLTPLVANPAQSVETYVTAFIDRLRDDVTRRLRAFK